MGLSTIAPALQQAFAHDVIKVKQGARGVCPADFQLIAFPFGQHPDHNVNGHVCLKSSFADNVRRIVVVDDNLKSRS